MAWGEARAASASPAFMCSSHAPPPHCRMLLAIFMTSQQYSLLSPYHSECPTHFSPSSAPQHTSHPMLAIINAQQSASCGMEHAPNHAAPGQHAIARVNRLGLCPASWLRCLGYFQSISCPPSFPVISIPRAPSVLSMRRT